MACSTCGTKKSMSGSSKGGNRHMGKAMGSMKNSATTPISNAPGNMKMGGMMRGNMAKPARKGRH